MVRVDGRELSNSLIQIRGLDKTYRRGGEEIHVLQGLQPRRGPGRVHCFHGRKRIR